jgi:hypothetical protein
MFVWRILEPVKIDKSQNHDCKNHHMTTKMKDKCTAKACLYKNNEFEWTKNDLHVDHAYH